MTTTASLAEPPLAVTVAAPPPGRPPAKQWVQPAVDIGAGVVAILAAAAAPLVALARAAGASAPATTPTARALAAAAGRGWHLDLLNGLPAGLGIRELGPVLGYVTAPFVHATSSPVAGEDVGAAVLGLLALVAAVAAVWRRLGPQSALCVAGLVDVWLLIVGPAALRDASPGLAVIVPAAAVVVLLAASLSGTRGGWLWAAVLGSFVAQTRLTAALPIGVLVLCGGLAAMAAASDEDRLELPVAWWRSAPRPLGLLALALVWVPTIVGAFHDKPSNVRLLWDWWRNGHAARAGWGVAAKHALLASTLLPLGEDQLVRHPTTVALAVSAAALVVVAFVARWVGRRRCVRAGRGLVGFSALAFALAVLAYRRSPGPVTVRTDGWLAWIPLALVLALALGMLGPHGEPPLGPVGVKAVLKAVKKAIKKEKGRHYVPKFNDGDRGSRNPGKAAAKREKAAKKLAEKQAKKAAQAAKEQAKAGSPSPLRLGWLRPPTWLAVPLAVGALVAGGFLVVAVSGGPAARTPAVVAATPPPAATPGASGGHARLRRAGHTLRRLQDTPVPR